MTGVVATIQMGFDRGPWSARQARRAVQDCLNDETPTETMENAALLTSELVTNAVTHSLSAGELVAYYDRLAMWLRVEVRDNSPVLPQMQDRFTVGRVGGLGLWLVDTLASRWGTTATATGKTVWFELKWSEDGAHRGFRHAP
jgi:anti-sigma regulatory factor (Ser/Thr protein kinase)